MEHQGSKNIRKGRQSGQIKRKAKGGETLTQGKLKTQEKSGSNWLAGAPFEISAKRGSAKKRSGGSPGFTAPAICKSTRIRDCEK